MIKNSSYGQLAERSSIIRFDKKLRQYNFFMAIDTHNYLSQKYGSPEEKLSLLSGLSLGQVYQAKKCTQGRCCQGCYQRLISLTHTVQEMDENQQVQHAALRASRAITIIKQSHPFSLSLIRKFWPDFEERNLKPIHDCDNITCKCKRIWVDLKNCVEKISLLESRRTSEIKELQEFRDPILKPILTSSNEPYCLAKKNRAHLIYITEETIEELTKKLDPLIEKTQELILKMKDTEHLHQT
jgi:hypothetical protein